MKGYFDRKTSDFTQDDIARVLRMIDGTTTPDCRSVCYFGDDAQPVDVGALFAHVVSESAEFKRRAEAAESDAEKLRDVLLRNGFVTCNIPACNCNSWHGRYFIFERWQEIKDELDDAGVLDNSTGNLPLNALRKLREQKETAEAALTAARAEAEKLRKVLRSIACDKQACMSEKLELEFVRELAAKHLEET